VDYFLPVDAVVWLVPGRRLDGEVEREIQAVLAEGPRRLGELVDDVAERLIERECARSGGAPEVALMAARVFPARVAQTIAAIDGDVVRVAADHAL